MVSHKLVSAAGEDGTGRKKSTPVIGLQLTVTTQISGNLVLKVKKGTKKRLSRNCDPNHPCMDARRIIINCQSPLWHRGSHRQEVPRRARPLHIICAPSVAHQRLSIPATTHSPLEHAVTKPQEAELDLDECARNLLTMMRTSVCTREQDSASLAARLVTAAAEGLSCLHALVEDWRPHSRCATCDGCLFWRQRISEYSLASFFIDPKLELPCHPCEWIQYPDNVTDQEPPAPAPVSTNSAPAEKRAKRKARRSQPKTRSNNEQRTGESASWQAELAREKSILMFLEFECEQDDRGEMQGNTSSSSEPSEKKDAREQVSTGGSQRQAQSEGGVSFMLCILYCRTCLCTACTDAS